MDGDSGELSSRVQARLEQLGERMAELRERIRELTSQPVQHGSTAEPPGSAPEEDAQAAATRRVDLLSQVTRLLLDGQSLSEPVTLHRVAWLLQADAAEWVIIDLVRGAPLRPGPAGEGRVRRRARGRAGAAGPVRAVRNGTCARR